MPGQPTAIDSRQFRTALGAFATGVTIVTTRDQQGNDIGLTASSFNSVSLEPPLILWSLARNAASLPAFMSCEHFAVHVLSSAQQDLSDRFSRKGSDKFAGIATSRGPSDIALLNDCAAVFVCRMAYRYDGGDHLILVGEVIHFEHGGQAPLLFHGGKYGRVLPKLPTDADDENGVGSGTLGMLLGEAALQLYQPVKRAWQDAGLCESEYYALMSLAKGKIRPRAEVERLLALGAHKLTDDTLQRLVGQQLLETSVYNDIPQLQLTLRGTELVVRLAATAKAIEAQAAEQLDREDLALLKNMLRKIILNSRSMPDLIS